MPNKTDKVIVTNFAALVAKYGEAGLQKIKSAVEDVIKADKKRGLSTTLIALDDPQVMHGFNAAAVTSAANPKQNKSAIDGVYKALAPDYILILGSIDVVPHQDLKNPLYTPGDPDADPDKIAY